MRLGFVEIWQLRCHWQLMAELCSTWFDRAWQHSIKDNRVNWIRMQMIISCISANHHSNKMLQKINRVGNCVQKKTFPRELADCISLFAFPLTKAFIYLISRISSNQKVNMVYHKLLMICSSTKICHFLITLKVYYFERRFKKK